MLYVLFSIPLHSPFCGVKLPDDCRKPLGHGIVDLSGQTISLLGHCQTSGFLIQSSVDGGHRDLVRDFVNLPLNLTREYPLAIGGEVQEMLGRISPVAEPGWAVVVQKPAATAFSAARQMVFQTALSTAVLAVLASLLAVWVSRAISRRPESTPAPRPGMPTS